MARDIKLLAFIRERLSNTIQWLADEAPYTSADQKHLDPNTPERAYYHLGYASALDDILELAEKADQKT